MDSGTCLGCGARISWAVTEKGKVIPLNPPEKRFIMKMVADVETLTHVATVQLVETYVSHFATCPKAADFRKEQHADARKNA
jgi:hypothetical protein